MARLGLWMLRRPTVIFLISSLAATICPTHAFYLEARDSESCPSSYQKCGGTGLPASFCCPSSSTCVNLDNASSVICCPKGQSCAYIEPINCNLQLQNATLYPTNPIKTTKLNGQLPKCGDSCCPFGYTCKGDQLCELDSPSTTTTSPTSPSTKTNPPKPTTPPGTTTATNTPTINLANPTTAPSDTNPPTAKTPITDTNSTAAAMAQTCPSFPSQAVLAGFFPGAVFGAVLAAMAMVCTRKWQKRRTTDPAPIPQKERSYLDTPVSISHPIPTDDSSIRTDFLRRTSRTSSRSMLHRTGTRVKSIFGSNARFPAPPLNKTPPLPLPPPRRIHRQPSTESIRVYTPQGGLPDMTK
ncbi:hypothetical protein BDV25DRAFT_154274 [Aspergillus avenaceus]|uniref:GPI transamidase component PIG-S n=1 Tax=Aspergillus avenaceus TaxID=36643 RepID=A0A5N6TW75_ASPAV|nr:hypothetical protein BDV25DRAFT_154274 [Aspergillus avenaceus]